MSKKEAHKWNPYLQKSSKEQVRIQDLVSLIIEGDRTALSQALTVIEDQRLSEIDNKRALLSELLPVKSDYAVIGITGAPGVGKSTAIEALGQQWIKLGYKVAVLSIDPSSRSTRGSILGDKTRMNSLSNRDAAFIRPSPAGDMLGGVAQSTYLSSIVCAAAGYDLIIIETVGVGQSEVEVSNMCDLFTLLLEPGAGDDLQGIKRGIMELADLVFISKSETNPPLALETLRSYRHALHLMTGKDHGLPTEVSLHDSFNKETSRKSAQLIIEYVNSLKESGHLKARRQEQRLQQMQHWTHYFLIQNLKQKTNNKSMLNDIQDKVKSGQLDAFSAAIELTRHA